MMDIYDKNSFHAQNGIALHPHVLNALPSIYYDFHLINSQRLLEIVTIVGSLMWELEEHPGFDIHFNQLWIYDKLTFNHSINVALLATLIATQMGYRDDFVRNVTIGALFHDLGKLLIPREILNKPSSLTIGEFEIVMEHPVNGERMLRHKKVSEDVLKAVRQHHERWTGHGYPDSLCKEQIHRSAQIVAVADVFEALTADRPYRKGLHPYHALEMILSGEGTDFAPDVVIAFRNALLLYPENSMVVLNTGEIGAAIAVPMKLPTRPLVRILFDEKGNGVHNQRVIDLIQELTYSVSSIKYYDKAESYKWLIPYGCKTKSLSQGRLNK